MARLFSTIDINLAYPALTVETAPTPQILLRLRGKPSCVPHRNTHTPDNDHRLFALRVKKSGGLRTETVGPAGKVPSGYPAALPVAPVSSLVAHGG